MNSLALSPALDAAALAPRYAERARIQVRDILNDSAAERIRATLDSETDWGVAFNDGAKVVQLSGERAGHLTAEQRRDLLATIHARARSGYQFFYDHFPLSSALASGRAVPPALSEFFTFLNSETTLDFVRTVTGLEAIRWADAHATRYRAGHFLKYHTDENAAEARLAAYVFNFTKDWGRDWGGYLQFFDQRYDIEAGYRPVFNALNLFTVPADHSVGMVAAYVRNSRLSITGWFRSDSPPAGAR